MKYILIIGAKSDIAKAYAKLFASKGYSLVLAGRNINTLNDFKKELETKNNITADLEEFDILNVDNHKNFIHTISTKLYGVICCAGYLGNQEKAEKEIGEAHLIWNTNFTACASLLVLSAEILKQKKEGFIIGISSVAGDRGRKSNYFYGSAKAGFTAFLSGLRAQLHPNQIHVLTVKPGFVYTKMTSHLTLPKWLTTTPDVVAKKSFKALQKKKNTIYVLSVWRYLMLIIKMIPETIFKRLSL